MAHTRGYKGEKTLPNIQIKHTIGDILLPLEGINNISDPVTGKYFAQARFYDPAHGRMLAPDPVKRGLNGYPYCSNDPVNYVGPTGEVASILAGGILGGTFGFAGSAISQIVGGKEFDVREALGAGASGMVVGAVRGALIGSGAGLPVALVLDFTAGTVGSTLEQLITGGKADARKSIAGGLTNAVSGAIYGNGPLGSLGLVPFGRTNDPRRGCMACNPFGGMTEGVSDYGYQYQMPRSERPAKKEPERFSLAEFGREIVTGFVMGGLASAAFYGAGRAVEAVKSSVRSGYECGSKADFY
ncbi:MAG: RHS repeat-associated core domain-containing protein, partial [Lachnospiraceae bacterium]|nr:RHS repeat-associated core domain-containing protein [Lachnospiraceae bacterium]